jgi:iron complex outermembrane recepter protein
VVLLSMDMRRGTVNDTRRGTKTWRAMWVVWLACVWVMAGMAQAQDRRVPGVVLDQSGAPVAGARVTAEHEGRGVASATTDRDGRFSLQAVPEGARVLVVSKPRFREARVALATSSGLPLRIVLDVAPVAEQVRVSPPVIDETVTDAFGGSTTVVSAAQVEQLSAVDLASALRRTPGVTISRFNPVGAFGGESGGAVFVRGTGASRPGSEIKTFVDGVPFYMGIWGHPLLDLLPVQALDQVQVHKGPQPQAFGNAFSAVDLGTRRARTDGVAGSVRASAGAFGTVVEQAEITARGGMWDMALAQGIARSDGHRDQADGRLASVVGRAAVRWSPRWAVTASALFADNDAGDPGVVGQPETRMGRFGTTGTLGSVAVTHDHARARGSLQLYANRGEGNWRGQLPPDGDTFTSFALAGLRAREHVAPWSGAIVTGGLDVDRIRGDVRYDRVPPAPRTRLEADPLTLVAPHVGLTQLVDVGRGWSLQPSAGARWYAHSVFEGETAPHAGLVVRGPRAVALRVQYAKGVNYPGQEVVALSQLIPPLGDTWRQLRPETMGHVEAGVSVAPSPGTTIDVAVFRDRVDRRYVFAFPPVVSRPSFTNLGAHTVRGVEAAVQQRLGRTWQAFGGLTLLDASLPRLPYVPERSIVAGLTGMIGPVRIAVDAQHQSAMTVFARARAYAAADANTARVDGFTVVHLRPSWVVPRAAGRVEVFAAIENLLDESYAYRPGYPMPGAWAQAGITLRFGGR